MLEVFCTLFFILERKRLFGNSVQILKHPSIGNLRNISFNSHFKVSVVTCHRVLDPLRYLKGLLIQISVVQFCSFVPGIAQRSTHCHFLCCPLVLALFLFSFLSKKTPSKNKGCSLEPIFLQLLSSPRIVLLQIWWQIAE